MSQGLTGVQGFSGSLHRMNIEICCKNSSSHLLGVNLMEFRRFTRVEFDWKAPIWKAIFPPIRESRCDICYNYRCGASDCDAEHCVRRRLSLSCDSLTMTREKGRVPSAAVRIWRVSWTTSLFSSFLRAAWINSRGVWRSAVVQRHLEPGPAHFYEKWNERSPLAWIFL